MGDKSTITKTEYNVLGSTGAHEIVTRAAERNGGANQAIVPGTVMQIDEGDDRNCEPWDGGGEMSTGVVCGIALEAMTLTSSAQPLNILVSGSVNNEEIVVHGQGVPPTPEQWNQIASECGVIPQGFEYGTLN